MTEVNLSTANEFIARHIGPRAGDEQAMLNSLGFDSLEALSASVIPESIKGTSVLGMDDGLSEADALAMIKSIAGKNQLFKLLLLHQFILMSLPEFHVPRADSKYFPVVLPTVVGRMKILPPARKLASWPLTAITFGSARIRTRPSRCSASMCRLATGQRPRGWRHWPEPSLPPKGWRR